MNAVRRTALLSLLCERNDVQTYRHSTDVEVGSISAFICEYSEQELIYERPAVDDALFSPGA